MVSTTPNWIFLTLFTFISNVERESVPREVEISFVLFCSSIYNIYNSVLFTSPVLLQLKLFFLIHSNVFLLWNKNNLRRLIKISAKNACTPARVSPQRSALKLYGSSIMKYCITIQGISKEYNKNNNNIIRSLAKYTATHENVWPLRVSPISAVSRVLYRFSSRSCRNNKYEKENLTESKENLYFHPILYL